MTEHVKEAFTFSSKNTEDVVHDGLWTTMSVTATALPQVYFPLDGVQKRIKKYEIYFAHNESDSVSILPVRSSNVWTARRLDG